MKQQAKYDKKQARIPRATSTNIPRTRLGPGKAGHNTETPKSNTPHPSNLGILLFLSRRAKERKKVRTPMASGPFLFKP